MAITPDGPSVTVEVLVGGKPLADHDCTDEYQLKRTGMKYIKAQTDKQFVMETAFDLFHDSPVVAATAYMNGQPGHGKLITLGCIQDKKECSIEGVRFMRNGKQYIQNYLFRQVQTALDKDTINKISNIGTLRFTMRYVKNVRHKEWADAHP